MGFSGGHRSSGGRGGDSLTDKPAGLPETQRKHWRDRYVETHYRDLPWFSTRPYPGLRRVVESGGWKPGTRILDIGCGAGTNALFLSRAGFRAQGVDIAPGAIAAAKRRAERLSASVEFRISDALQLPFPARCFGGVTDIGCFHTLPVRLRSAYAKEVARVLRPSGRYFLACVAREFTGELGPPHRLALEEISRVFESQFVFLSTTFTGGWRDPRLPRGGLPAYDCLMLLRSEPQPPRR